MLLRCRPTIVACTLLVSSALCETIDEYQVKARFVSSFANFVEWPPEAFGNPHGPFIICVLGRNPFGGTLASLVAGQAVGEHPVVLREIADVAKATGCHIVFVSSSERLRLRSILTSLGQPGVFSIGDTRDFIAEGGVANLRLDRENRVRIDISAGAAKERRLQVSSRLLQLATVLK
jgi:hypothetical protein